MPESLYQPRIRLLTASPGIQLTYALRTDPAPLTASISIKDALLASIELVVTNDTAAPLAIAEIDVTIDVGAEGNDLVTQTTLNSGMTISGIANLSPQPAGAVTQGEATFSVIAATTPVSLAAGASFVIAIYGLPINTTTGSSTITIAESIGSVPPAPPNVTFEVTKFPYGFFLNDLIVNVPDGSDFMPVAQVNHGIPVTLQWDGSQPTADSYKLVYSTNGGQVEATLKLANSWTSPALVSDTTFTLTMAAPTSQGGKVKETRSITVGVALPDVVASTLSATDLSLTGAVTSALKMNSNATVAGTLGVTGETTLAGLITSGNATINGATTLAAGAGISGALTLPGIAQTFGLNGSMTPLALPRVARVSVAYQSTTDGFLILSFNASNGPNAPQFAPVGVAVMANNIWFGSQATMYMDQGYCVASFPLLTVPIAANTPFEIQIFPYYPAVIASYEYAWFLPIGQGGKITSVPPSLDRKPPPQLMPHLNAAASEPENRFLVELRAGLDGPNSDAFKRELAALLALAAKT